MKYPFEISFFGIWYHGEILLDYEIDDGAFDYEYGSIKGTHRYEPEVVDLFWEIDNINGSKIILFLFKKWINKLIQKEVDEIDHGDLIQHDSEMVWENKCGYADYQRDLMKDERGLKSFMDK